MIIDTSIYEYARQGLSLGANRTALWFCGKSLSFGTLFEQIDNLADHLYKLGIRRGTAVTIHLPNCPYAVMAVYAVAKLGGICNMVHPQLTAEGLRSNMDFVQSTMLITRDDFADNIEADFARTVISVSLTPNNEERRNTIALHRICFDTLLTPCQERAVVPEPDTLGAACVCYLNSSGTTGTPKTVMHSHSAINEWSRSAEVYFRTHNEEPSELVWLSTVPPFHGMGFAALLHHVISSGGKQVQMARWDVEGAVGAIKAYNVNVLLGVPTMHHSLLNHKDFSRCAGSSLRWRFVSGERTDAQMKKTVNEQFDGCAPLLDCYGLTETVACRCVIDRKKYHLDSVGYPMDGCDFAVMDHNGQLHPNGTGELMISSRCTMMGYLKDDQATAEVLVSHQEKTWVRTGDYGRIAEDGSVFFIERLKEVIIRKGCNIYPAEIEAIIRRLPGVQDVCVVGVMSRKMETEHVRACVIAERDYDLDQLRTQINDLCAESLPRYSVPEEICFYSQFARTNLGKINRKALEQLQ